jgi:hypothetical protein
MKCVYFHPHKRQTLDNGTCVYHDDRSLSMWESRRDNSKSRVSQQFSFDGNHWMFLRKGHTSSSVDADYQQQ